ncbi:hypothetical protein VZT92_015761 [Zoarces viviparus]|uniref:Uncharacterized protein n=1 Tax=Zoarces viviparus TaxID=48416 RepID=A0AAW1EWR4_ZOAVI
MSEWRWERWRLTETSLSPGLSGITCCWSGVEEDEEEEEGMEVEEVGLLEDEEEEEAEDEVELWAGASGRLGRPSLGSVEVL